MIIRNYQGVKYEKKGEYMTPTINLLEFIDQGSNNCKLLMFELRTNLLHFHGFFEFCGNDFVSDI